MDLTSVRGIDADVAKALALADVGSVADLARAPDAAALAAAASLDPALVAQLQAAAQERIVQAFHDAGVGDESALAAADPDDVAKRTGIARADVEWFQEAAREALREAAPFPRVVLKAGARSASAFVTGGAFEALPLVTARGAEDADKLLSTAPGDAILVQEGVATARVRVGGAVHEEVPLYRDDGAGRLTRVRVAAVREKKVVEKGRSLLDRIRRRA